MPIKSLNVYSNDWCIKARVVKKADLRQYKNARGEGCILNLDLIDREQTMIQATAFNETAKKLDAEIQQDKVYLISGGQIKTANKKFTAIKNDYNIILGFDSRVEEAGEDRKINKSAFSFTLLSQVEQIVQ